MILSVRASQLYHTLLISCCTIIIHTALFADGQVTWRRVIWRNEPVSYPDEFPVAPKQLSVKIEMVLPEDKLVEEFYMFWDEELNLTRYDFALGRIMAPFNMTRPMKTIHDFGNGIAFFIDGTLTNCSMYPLGYLLTDQNATNTPDFRYPRRYISSGNITLHHLLRTIHPKQLFSMDNSTRVLNKTTEIIRGIPCDVWEVTVDKYYVPGYGVVKTFHRLYYMSKEFARYLVGEVPYRIPVQRAIFLVSSIGSLTAPARTPRIILNFFDFTVPTVPTVYDFSISSCIPKGKLETRESIQIRFPGNFTGLRADQFIQPFRKKVLQRIVKIGDISPVRAIGMYFSQDTTSMYITATILPRPPVLLHYTLIQNGVAQSVTRLPNSEFFSSAHEQLSSCAANCDRQNDNCNKFGWCARQNGDDKSSLRRCILAFESPRVAPALPAPGSDLFVCDVYQRIINSSTYDGGVLETLFKVLVDIQAGNFTISVANNVTGVNVSAEDMRTDVSLHDDSITPTATDSRTSFDFYKGHAMIVNAGVKDSFSKLSPAECRQHCLDEKRFVCQSVASCAYGDCVVSHLHGDELLNTISGKPSISAHSHCAIWTRTWKGMFTLASLLVPKSPPDMVITSVSNEDTCAKECLFGNMTCESFSFCSTSVQAGSGSTVSSLSIGSSRKTAGKFQHECQLFKSHAFDVMHDEREYKPGCWHLSRNYVNDFEIAPGYELFIAGDTEIIQREIEPALERWHCAQECIRQLGDDGCLAFDICDDLAALTDDIISGAANYSDIVSSTSVRCRISSSYIGPQLTNSSKKVRANENCTLYTRKTYLDGTMINPKTVAATNSKRDVPSLQIPPEMRQTPGLLVAPSKPGYSISEMAGLAVGMLIIGVVATSVCFALWRRSPNSPGVTFTRDIPFVRFS